MEAFMALFRNQFDGAGKIVRGVDETRLAGALHPDRHIGDVRLGRSRDERRRPDQTDEPLRRLEGGVRHVPSVGAQVPQISDEYYPAVECLLSRSTATSRRPQSGYLRIEGRKAAAARRWPRGKIIYSRTRSW